MGVLVRGALLFGVHISSLILGNSHLGCGGWAASGRLQHARMLGGLTKSTDLGGVTGLCMGCRKGILSGLGKSTEHPSSSKRM